MQKMIVNFMKDGQCHIYTLVTSALIHISCLIIGHHCYFRGFTSVVLRASSFHLLHCGFPLLDSHFRHVVPSVKRVSHHCKLLVFSKYSNPTWNAIQIPHAWQILLSWKERLRNFIFWSKMHENCC